MTGGLEHPNHSPRLEAAALLSSSMLMCDVFCMTSRNAQADDDTKTHTSEIRIHPNGSMVFVANRGQDTVACLSVDQETGALKEASRAKTAHTPQALELDPEGAFLYAAGGAPGGEAAKTDGLTVFKVDRGKGELVRVEEVQLGKNPIRLLAVTLHGQ